MIKLVKSKALAIFYLPKVSKVILDTYLGGSMMYGLLALLFIAWYLMNFRISRQKEGWVISPRKLSVFSWFFLGKWWMGRLNRAGWLVMDLKVCWGWLFNMILNREEILMIWSNIHILKFNELGAKWSYVFEDFINFYSFNI